MVSCDPSIHHRHSIRLKDYDYSSNGLYFITLCTQNKAMLFGEIVGADLVSARIKLNRAGSMVETVYKALIDSTPNIESDIYTIMPNHFHCILRIDWADTRSAPTASIPAVIQAFKSKTTVEYIGGVKSGQYPPFDKRIWQRNYYERVIRDEDEYLMIWKYIEENPAKWREDIYHP